MRRAIIVLVAIGAAAAAIATTAVATSAPPQPAISTLATSGSIAVTWAQPTQCSDWYQTPDGGRWEFWCIWGSWEDDFWVEAYYWNEDNQLTELNTYCGGSGWLPSFCCTVSPEGGMCDA